MPPPPSPSPTLPPPPAMPFWTRPPLTPPDQLTCLTTLLSSYPNYHIQDPAHQGHCSHTYLLTPRPPASQAGQAGPAGRDLILQLRPPRHHLRLDIARAAREVYGALAPEVRAVGCCFPGGLWGYEMGRVRGGVLSLLLHQGSGEGLVKRRTLVASLAHLLARSWPGGKVLIQRRRDSVLQPSSSLLPSSEAEASRTMLSRCTGKVGAQIAPKLRQLAAALPDNWLRAKAQEALAHLQTASLADYPAVLTHGDLIPSNILVDDETWHITGLVDWAEAEILPFGTCLYGLEHLLGTLRHISHPHDGEGRWVWVYDADAEQLRHLFYDALTSLVPELKHRREELWLMRDIGIFLWHGFAWDEGAIDRVVDEGSDGGEVAMLRGMLGVSLDPVLDSSAGEREHA